MTPRGAPRVLVTEVQERAGLAAIRALARAGFVVGGAASSRPAQGHWSRDCHDRWMLPDPRAGTEAYAERLARVLDRRGYDIVLPTTDASLIAVSQHRARLGKDVLHGFPTHDVVLACLDKVRLLEIAAESDLTPPKSIVRGDLDGVRAAVDQLGWPAVVKPHASVVRVGPRLHSQRSVVVRTPREIGTAVARLGSPYVVQRYIGDGRIVSFAGVFDGERSCALAAARYLRTWPPDVGAASLAETLEPPTDVVRRVEHLLSIAGWQGVFEVEMMRDPDGELHCIDLNPRLHGWLGLAVGAGANIPAVWCSRLLGSQPPFVAARAGVRYRWEDGEFLSLVRNVTRGDVAGAASCLRPHRRTVHAAFAARDPLPVGARVAWVARRLPGWLLRRRGVTSSTDEVGGAGLTV